MNAGEAPVAMLHDTHSSRPMALAARSRRWPAHQAALLVYVMRGLMPWLQDTKDRLAAICSLPHQRSSRALVLLSCLPRRRSKGWRRWKEDVVCAHHDSIRVFYRGIGGRRLHADSPRGTNKSQGIRMLWCCDCRWLLMLQDWFFRSRVPCSIFFPNAGDDLICKD
jgi:hypothetical protein